MLFFSQAVCQGAINTRSSSRFPGHLGCCTRSHPRAARGAFTRCRFVYAEQRGRPGCEGLPGLDKAGLRHRSGRSSCHGYHGERRRERAQPSTSALAQPLPAARATRVPIIPDPSPRISILALCPPPTEPEDRLAPAGLLAPSTSALALYPPPMPDALAKVLVESGGQAHVLCARLALLQVRRLLETVGSNSW